MSNRVNKIVKRIYYAVEISLRSPLALSNGENETTDMDVLRNSLGEAFIPGTSIAGAFRNYLKKEKTQECSFGFSKGEEGRMSSVSISDIYFEKISPPAITVRDGVQLSEGKHVRNKCDRESIEAGAAGMLYLNYTLRENDRNVDAEQEVKRLICAVENGELRFGSNKNRGFGRFLVKKVYQSTFTAENVDEWIIFSKRIRDVSAYAEKKEYTEWIQGYRAAEQYDTIRISLKLTGGISIRKYSAEPMKADFEHITSNGAPIVPGTSWNGAIREDIKRILLELGFRAEKANYWIDRWFGYVHIENKRKAEKQKENEPEAQQSMVVIGESIIHDSVRVPMTRNKINRFDASTIESALYSEITSCGGNTELEIKVKKNEKLKYRALLAVLELVVQDISKGYVAVGGQTAVGRGIFSGSTDGILEEKMRKDGQKELLSLIEDREGE